MPIRSATLRVAQAACLALLAASAVLAQGTPPAPTFEEQARQDFARLPESSALLWDASTIGNFLQVDAPDVLEVLIRAYLRPPTEPKGPVAHLLASAIRQRYDPSHPFRPMSAAREGWTKGPRTLTDEDAERLTQLIEKYGKHEVHAWATFNACHALASAGRGAGALPALLDKKANAVQRAAALEGMSRAGEAAVLEQVPALLEERIRNKLERTLVVEAAAWAVARWARGRLEPPPAAPAPRGAPRGGQTPEADDKERAAKAAEAAKAAREAVRPHLEPLIALLDDPTLPDRAARQVARALQHALRASEAYPDAKTWRLELDQAGQPPARGDRVQTKARFMGIEVDGERIAFLLDGSDSMLTPLTPAEKEAMEKLLGGDATPRRGRSSGTRGRDELEVDFQRVETRFDAAREHLKHTLYSLPKGVAFVVILFGDDAELCEATPRFIPSGPKSAALVAHALHAIEPGRKTPDRPSGTLRGQTNIYGALDLAFRVSFRGLADADTAYADPRLLLEGADAVFLLSDGKPTRDGFPGQTPMMEVGGFWREAYEGEVTDPETGQKRKVKYDREWIPKRTQRLGYAWGPYTMPDPLSDALLRLNLIRRAPIHTIAIGEADTIIPRRIAEESGGRWVRIGEEPKPEPGR